MRIPIARSKLLASMSELLLEMESFGSLEFFMVSRPIVNDPVAFVWDTLNIWEDVFEVSDD